MWIEIPDPNSNRADQPAIPPNENLLRQTWVQMDQQGRSLLLPNLDYAFLLPVQA
jgi:hypothetical protein